MRAYASQGIGEPAYCRPPLRNRATKVSRSGNFTSAPPVFGVTLGVLNQSVWSTLETGIGSISMPPAKSGPVGAKVIGLRGVWHPTQLPTERAMYSPRSIVGARGGALGAGLMVRRGRK